MTRQLAKDASLRHPPRSSTTGLASRRKSHPENGAQAAYRAAAAGTIVAAALPTGAAWAAPAAPAPRQPSTSQPRPQSSRSLPV